MWYHRQVSHAGITIHIQKNTVRLNYFSLPEIPAFGPQIPISGIYHTTRIMVAFQILAFEMSDGIFGVKLILESSNSLRAYWQICSLGENQCFETADFKRIATEV